ncbi:phosphodiesterase [Exiguobacterium sp. SH1S21]|uniref:putative bifunctional diguanylate cyclase/phosphodiesterase n=1 Tax=Exiguobacterium sp. SH1S21 TaxID=2510953 RepID=UPI00103AB966|nr:EAL domain-containing protein [Exiguobacterium sp. SH1S21]TCI57474.1 phosphodiesterase [Exiguobacterium sp. SH1S21]
MTRFTWINPLKSRLAANELPVELADVASDRHFIEGHLDPLYLLDTSGTIVDCNEKLSLLLGYTKRELHTHFARFTTETDAERIHTYFASALSGTEETYTCVAKRKDGRMLTLQITNIPAYDDQLIVGVYGIARDITNEDRLKSDVERFRDLYEHVEASIYRKDLRTGKLEFYTAGFETLFQTAPKAMGEDPSSCHHVIHQNDLAKVRAAHTHVEAGQETTVLYRTNLNDSVNWVEERLIPKFDDDGTVIAVISIAHDITRLKTQEEQIWQLAMHNSLTGLPNRSLFLHELCERIEQHEHIAVLTISFNSIHRINHDFGYKVGDDWIVAATSALLHRLPNGSFVGHLGGDEFMLLLTDITDESSLITSCQSLLQLGDKQIQVGPYEWRPPVSIGVSRYPHDSTVAEELLQYANTALGRTNLPGMDRFVFYASSFNIDSYRRHQLGNDLSRAIDENELFLEFQPKVDAWSGRIVGAEALVRWQHPEWGRIPPNDFIPLSEESDLHIQLADWVLHHTCAHLRDWQDKDLPVVPVSINVSPKRLSHGQYAETVTRALSHYTLPPSLLEIEILETDVLNDNRKIHDTLEQLDAANIRVALDDFGTGYSSLSYLQQYPIKTIKIDQQFAADLHKNKKTQAIVRTILFMAEEFAMDVVIEGVETLEQLDVARRLNCRIVQGYLFSRPLGAEQFERTLEDRFLATTETVGSAVTRQAFSLEASVTIHKFHDRELSIGSTPIVVTKNGLQSLHFHAPILLPVTEAIELKIFLPQIGDKTDILVRLVRVTELESGLFEYEASYLDTSESHRVMMTLQQNTQVPKSSL